jgi:hypothetical protein
MKLSSRLSCNLLALMTVCGASCSTPESGAPAASNTAQYYIVSAGKALFYRYGPQQANGPDGKLPQGTVMTLIRPAFGYSKIQLLTGLQGYVATQDIQVAPPEVVQARTNPDRPLPGESNRHLRFHNNMVDPRFLPPPPPLPEDQPEPTPIPGTESSPAP